MWRLNSQFLHVHMKNVQISGKRAHPYVSVIKYSERASYSISPFYVVNQFTMQWGFYLIGYSHIVREEILNSAIWYTSKCL